MARAPRAGTAAEPAKVVRRCATCARIRAYEAADRYCLACGTDGLESGCACGRAYDYALGEMGDLFCPRCGRGLQGRVDGFES